MSNREGKRQVVWLDDERCFGLIIGPLNAYYTQVRYVKSGIEYEVMMESNEFTLMEDFFEYDSDD